MPHIDTATSDRIRELNDAFRKSFGPTTILTQQSSMRIKPGSGRDPLQVLSAFEFELSRKLGDDGVKKAA